MLRKNGVLVKLYISEEEIGDYSFVNTGDFLILFACGAYERKNGVDSKDKSVAIIKKIAKLIDNNLTVANQTRTKEMFDKVEENM